MRRPKIQLLGLLFVITEAVAPQAATAQKTSLDGDWHFVADPGGRLGVGELTSASGVRPARVPSSWQIDFVDLRDYAGPAWYWRSVNLEPLAPDQVALLHFGAVDYRADVYVNGRKTGSHEGGYSPFEFDITSLIHAGENQIAVRVADAEPKTEVEGLRYAELPHGKQSWYVQTSGLWQSVELDVRPRMHLGAVHVSAAADGNFKVEVPVVNVTRDLSTTTLAGRKVRAQILDSSSRTIWEGLQDLKTSQSNYVFTGRIAHPSPWSPKSPTLYRLSVSTASGDAQDYRFGFRTFETRGGRFYLNGSPIYLRGALDQDFYPDSGYVPPSLDYIRDEMRKAKALGLNLLRCHIKVPDPRYLDAADEAGVLVWYEIPNWDKLTADSERRGLETLRAMAGRDWNHPSVVIASVVNESWGINLKEPAERAWLKQAYNDAKGIVPWLVDDNSACCENFHMATDIADFHHYSAIPDHAADFDRLVDDLAQRPRWLFSPYNDGAPRGDEPLVLSEFGNWGLPQIPEQRPWWFGRDFGGRDLTLPEGFDKRFAEHEYNTLFPDVNALAEATEWAEYRALKYEIESLRMHPQAQGYVITEFTDVHWESNGLLDMWRRPKVFGEALGKLQQDDLVVLRAQKRNFTSGEKASADVYFSHCGSNDLDGGEIAWLIEGSPLSGKLALPKVLAASAVKVGTIEFTVPRVPRPSKVMLKTRVTAAGKTLSENSLDLFFYPRRAQEIPPPVAFHDPGRHLRRLVNEMRARDYQAPSGSEAFPVLITSTLDEEAKKALRSGGRVILMASERETLAPGVEVVPRGKSNLDGNWISSFLWTRNNQEPFKSISFDNLAGFETEAVTPSAVVQGIPPEHFRDVLAGMFYGWVHSSVGTLVQAKVGSGKLLICTFSLATTYGSDPYATYLVDALVNYAVSGFAPAFELPLTGQ